MSIQKLHHAGQVDFSSCVIIKNGGAALDIIAQVESITIYEDIFSPFITGKLTVRDTLDLPNILGRSGRDLLKIDIATPSIDKKQNISGLFVIYKMSDREKAKDRTQVYNLFFASEELFVDTNTHLSKKLVGPGHQVIENLLKSELKTQKRFISDKASNSVQYVSNFWTPSKNFAYISEHSVGPKNTPTCLFYENRDGFNFREIYSLYDRNIPLMQRFAQSDFVADIERIGMKAGEVTRDPNKDYTGIDGVRVDVSFDFLKDYLDGALISKLYSSDSVTKKIRWGRFDIVTNAVDSMNPQRLYTDSVIKATNPIVLNKNRGYGTHSLSEPSNYAILQRRISMMRQLQASKIEIDVFGRTDYTVGKKVSVNFNQSRSIKAGEEASEFLDRYYSGLYIVTAVSHQITRISHSCTLELCKESTVLK